MTNYELAKRLLEKRNILTPDEIDEELKKEPAVIHSIINGWLTETENDIRMVKERFLKDERDLTPIEREKYKDRFEQWKNEKNNNSKPRIAGIEVGEDIKQLLADLGKSFAQNPKVKSEPKKIPYPGLKSDSIKEER